MKDDAEKLKSFMPLLELLQDGEFHSGEELGAVLGITRAAVWKSLNQLPNYDVSLESVKAKGYRVPGGFELLDKKKIQKQLTTKLNDFGVLYSVDSTNSYLLEKTKQGLQAPAVCLAERQEQGKGRRGKQDWQSPFGKSISLSLSWQFEGGATALSGLSLAVGVCVSKALHNMGVDGIKLKWPNDIVYENKKLGGILLEVTGDALGPCQAIIGLGLNFNNDDMVDVEQPWITLSKINGLSRNQLVATLINEISKGLQEFSKSGFKGFKKQWLELDSLADSQVDVSTEQGIKKGIAQGVNDDGHLLVEINGKVESFLSAEVSVRQ